MKSKILNITLFLVIFIVCFSSCRKTEGEIDDSNIDFSNIEKLYEQPLSVIQQCIQGKWKWITYVDGIAGWILTDNGLVEVTKDKIISYEGVQEFYLKKQEVETPLGIIQTYVACEKGSNVPICFFEYIKNDTMKVSGFMFNPYPNEFIRITNNNK